MKALRSRFMHCAFAAIASLWCASASYAAPILSTPGLTSIRVFEASTVVTSFDFLVADARLTTRVVGDLNTTNFDFFGVNSEVTRELYDIFVSNAAGALDASGAFITIEGICRGASTGCFNISEVALVSGVLQFGSSVSNVVFGASGGLPGSELLAVDADTNTTTILGNTNGQPVAERMRLTIGFAAAVPVPVRVPEPASAWLVASALGLLALVRRLRRN